MPIYAYKCIDCGSVTESYSPVETRDVPIDCLECRSNMARIITKPGISFKGSGFYSTDKKFKK